MGVYGSGQGQLLHMQMLVASLWVALTAGFLFCFSSYSVALQHKFALSQGQISTIGTAQLAVNLVNFTCGLVVDLVGLRAVIIFGSALHAASWLLLGAIATLDWKVPNVMAWLAMLSALGTLGAACTVVSVFSALAKNFGGEERGAAIGIAKAWTGVAAGVITTVFTSILHTADSDPRRLGFLWVLGTGVVVLGLLPSPLVRVLSPSAAPLKARFRGHSRHIRQLTLVTLGLILATVAASLLEGTASQPLRAALSALLVTLVFVPGWLLLPGRSELGLAPPADDESSFAPELPEGSCSSLSLGGGEASPWTSGPLGIVSRLEGWLLWFAIFALQSGAVLLTTELGSIAQTRDGPHVSSASAVSMFSCAQSLGRLFGGFISDAVVARQVARPWCLVALLLGMGFAQALLCTSGPAALYIGVILTGYCFGSMYPILICTVTELFGTARIASNYMLFDGSPMALGCIIVAKLLSQAVFNSQAQQVSGGNRVCHGDECFRLTFLCTAILQLMAAMGTVVLALRSAEVYRASVWPTRLEEGGREAEKHAA